MSDEEAKEYRTVDIEQCGCCGKAHKDLIFSPFICGPPSGFTHWALCPLQKEPILILLESPDAAWRRKIHREIEEYKQILGVFKQEMENKFVKHALDDDKSGWNTDSVDDLFMSAKKYLTRAQVALSEKDWKYALRALVNTANLTLMTWNRLRSERIEELATKLEGK